MGNSQNDIEFNVPFVHRLRFTRDVAGDDFSVLQDVIEFAEGQRSKVLFVAERPIAETSIAISQIADQFSRASNIELVAPPMLVAGGEAIKNSSSEVEQILSAINQHDLDRRSYVIALGGGAMLDATGYAAAIAHRGIRLIRLPTTTLAQADSGVGVKNAINHFGKKNWVGTFAVPWAVINDQTLLQSLPDREFINGFSEAVKVSLLKDRDEFDWLCENAERIRDRDLETSTRAIEHACRLHLRHITEGGDPFEMLEARPLDFGHWSAHKLEPISEYRIRHGEAVATGVAIDCFYSTIKFGFPETDAIRVCQTLTNLGLSLWHDEIEPVSRLLEGLEEFRQHLGGRLTITMLRDVGDPINVHEIDIDAMSRAIAMLHQNAAELNRGGVSSR